MKCIKASEAKSKAKEMVEEIIKVMSEYPTILTPPDGEFEAELTELILHNVIEENFIIIPD